MGENDLLSLIDEDFFVCLALADIAEEKGDIPRARAWRMIFTKNVRPWYWGDEKVWGWAGYERGWRTKNPLPPLVYPYTLAPMELWNYIETYGRLDRPTKLFSIVFKAYSSLGLAMEDLVDALVRLPVHLEALHEFSD